MKNNIYQNNFTKFYQAITEHPLIKKKVSIKNQKVFVNDFKTLFNKYNQGETGLIDWNNIRPLRRGDIVVRAAACGCSGHGIVYSYILTANSRQIYL